MLAGEAADGLATLEDFGSLCDELEKAIIKDEMAGLEIDNGELELKLGDVSIGDQISFTSADDDRSKEDRGSQASSFDADLAEAKDAATARLVVTNMLEALATLQQKLSDLS